MRTKKTIIDNRPKIKIQVDYQTVITVRSINAFNAWKIRYPEAKIIN